MGSEWVARQRGDEQDWDHTKRAKDWFEIHFQPEGV